MNDEIRKRLHEIEERDGILKPETVVADARDPSSPLHGEFEWDPEKAQAAYLTIQARNLIARFKITIVVPDGAGKETTIRVREFHNPIQSGGQRGYFSIQKVASNEDLFFAMIETARAEARALKLRLDNLLKMKKLDVDKLLSALDEFIESELVEPPKKEEETGT